MASNTQALHDLRIDRPTANPAGRGRATTVGILLGLAVAAGGLAWWLRQPPVPAVRTALVQVSAPGSQQTLLNASGYVTARRQATVSSKVTGKVVEVLVEEGFKVEEGQVLARLDSSNIEANLRLAEAQLESSQRMLDETRASLNQANREWNRSISLQTNGIGSVSDLDKAEADARTLQARLVRQTADAVVAERQVTVWKQQMDDNIIRAPFSGIVTSKNAQPGEMISPISAGGGFTRTGICTMVDMTSLEIEVDVNESYINRVAAGQPVEATLDSYPDWRIPAKVIAIIPTADRQKSTVKVRVGFKQLDPRILPDMGVKVAFQSAGAGQAVARQAIVPKAAMRQVDGRDVAWVVHEGRLERRAVTVAGSRGDEVTVSAGLHDGERVVVDGPADLVDGSPVKEAKP